MKRVEIKRKLKELGFVDFKIKNTSIYYTDIELLKYWDFEKNAEIGKNPCLISKTSEEEVWWNCEKHGSYLVKVSKKNRLRDKCPNCLSKGKTSFAEVYPEHVKDWHPTLNGVIDAYDVSHAYVKEIWWNCEKHGEYKEAIHTKIRRKAGRCRKCKGGTPIFQLYPDLLKYWDFEKNDTDVSEIFSNCTDKFWWNCPIHNEGFVQPIQNVIHGYTDCIECKAEKTNSIVITHPELLKEWDYEKNQELGLDPRLLTYGSGVEAFWKCHDDNHGSYLQSVRNRVFGFVGCKICKPFEVRKDSVLITNPEVTEFWDYEKNTINLETITAGANKKFWFICPDCEESFERFMWRYLRSSKKCIPCSKKKKKKSVTK